MVPHASTGMLINHGVLEKKIQRNGVILNTYGVTLILLVRVLMKLFTLMVLNMRTNLIGDNVKIKFMIVWLNRMKVLKENKIVLFIRGKMNLRQKNQLENQPKKSINQFNLCIVVLRRLKM